MLGDNLQRVLEFQKVFQFAVFIASVGHVLEYKGGVGNPACAVNQFLPVF